MRSQKKLLAHRVTAELWWMFSRARLAVSRRRPRGGRHLRLVDAVKQGNRTAVRALSRAARTSTPPSRTA